MHNPRKNISIAVSESFHDWREWGIRRFRPRCGHQIIPFRGYDCMILYMVGKLALIQLSSPGGWSTTSSGGATFAPSPPQTGTTLRQPRNPSSLNDFGVILQMRSSTTTHSYTKKARAHTGTILTSSSSSTGCSRLLDTRLICSSKVSVK